jgi:hypothetical protein
MGSAAWMWHGIGLNRRVSLRKHVTRALLGAAICVTALVSVGLTAPSDGPFAIAVQPIFLRVDAAAITESRARALGVDVDVKLGPLHLHLGWSAIPLLPASTNSGLNLF